MPLHWTTVQHIRLNHENISHLEGQEYPLQRKLLGFDSLYEEGYLKP